MTSRDFCFWLQGVLEIGGQESFDKKQTTIIKNHLNMVFFHEIDPEMGDVEHQGKLNALHGRASLNLSEGSMSEVSSSTVELPTYMKGTEAELDAKYGVGIRPRC